MTEIMSAQEVADYLALSYRTVLELAKRGEVPGIRFGNTWRFHRAAIEGMFDNPQPDCQACAGQNNKQQG